MNYALDALWWRLTQPHVRSLATLLTAPTLWHSGTELSVRELLGERGFRYLLKLNDEPQPLLDYLAPLEPFANRLGLYAEHLLAFWFRHAPHTQLLAQNLPVCDSDGRTLGAFDFIALLNNTAYHIELTCKYYGTVSGAFTDFAGLNRQDRLSNKVAKLSQQLTLSQTPSGKQALAKLGLAQVQAVSIVRGMAFAPLGHLKEQAPLNTDAWHGQYLHQAYEYQPQAQHRYCVLPRMAYLAPARLLEAQTCDFQTAFSEENTLIAVLEKRVDGHWHEIHRLMKQTPVA